MFDKALDDWAQRPIFQRDDAHGQRLHRQIDWSSPPIEQQSNAPAKLGNVLGG
jgi:hypothetical protein